MTKTEQATHLVDNEDGTVTDTRTGLMWQQGTGNDGDPLSWGGALAHCEALDFAGHDDWRLPTIRELQSIIDYGAFKPAIDPTFAASSSWYWSSTSCAGFPDGAWGVDFGGGGVSDVDFKSYEHFVRAVRSGEGASGQLS